LILKIPVQQLVIFNELHHEPRLMDISTKGLLTRNGANFALILRHRGAQFFDILNAREVGATDPESLDPRSVYERLNRIVRDSIPHTHFASEGSRLACPVKVWAPHSQDDGITHRQKGPDVKFSDETTPNEPDP
jgi:hypothetical protein